MNENNRRTMLPPKNEIMFPESNSYHHCFERYNIKNKVKFPGTTEIHTLEIPKLPRSSDNTVLWEWMYFLSAEKEEEFKMIAKKNSVINEAVIKLEVLSKDEKARLLYESLEKKRKDEIAREEYVRECGEKRGEERGIALTKKVLRLSSENKSPQEIADYCQIPFDKVLEILE